MKFKTGFLLGAAAGVWAVNKASSLQQNRRASSSKRGSYSPDDAAEKLRALSGLARERLSELADGPLGTVARERLSELIGSSLSGAARSSESDRSWKGNGAGSVNGHDPTIDTTARWPK